MIHENTRKKPLKRLRPQPNVYDCFRTTH